MKALLILLNPGRVPYRSRRHSETFYATGRPSKHNPEEMAEARRKKEESK